MELMQLVADDNAGEARLRFPACSPFFAGHFPAAPILPGVVLIDAAVAIVAQARGCALELRRVAQVKFVSAVHPDEEVSFAFTVQRADDDAEQPKVRGCWRRGEEKVAELVFTTVPDTRQEDTP